MSTIVSDKRVVLHDLLRTEYGRKIIANSMTTVKGHGNLSKDDLDELRSKHRERINYLDSPAGQIEKTMEELEHKVIGKITGLHPPQRDRNKGE